MPLAPRRLAERGFNQALLLARSLARDKVEAQLLLRLRETGSQTALEKKARQRNVEGAFGVEPMRAGVLGANTHTLPHLQATRAGACRRAVAPHT